jgi:hypothetical protein
VEVTLYEAHRYVENELSEAALAALLLMAVGVLAGPAWAAAYTVTGKVDSGRGSLRQVRFVRRFPAYHEISESSERRTAVVALHVRPGWCSQALGPRGLPQGRNRVRLAGGAG